MDCLQNQGFIKHSLHFGKVLRAKVNQSAAGSAYRNCIY